MQGAPVIQGRRPPVAGATFVGGRRFSLVRGPHVVYRGGRAFRFVPYTALGAILIGGAYYYPYGYVPLVGPSCAGLTDDGCSLSWVEVPTLDGFSDFQCVAYCPWQY